jgi:glycosyltransferase involved in cell wall biosynthesis
VRNLLPIWAEEHELTLAGWEGGAYVRLDATQTGSILGKPDLAAPRSRRRLIPWGVPVLLPEVAKVGRSERLAALAEHSANFVGVLGYDCIPAVSAELVPEIEREKFGEYLEIVKYADVVACISQAAADEFSGFVGALEAQGVRGPVVVACGLPTSVTVEDRPKASPQGGLAEVLCVGSLDPRKNQIALVEAAEHLWRDGLTFRLRLIGSGGAQPVALKRLIGRLVRAGRPIVVGQEVTDASLHRAYCDARVVVFPTLHEGFGLPVVEALSYGVPVITSDFGSTREIAEGNGAVLVDPEDVWALASALRDVLTDDELHARLSRQATSRPTRTWDDYGAELWKALVP